MAGGVVVGLAWGLFKFAIALRVIAGVCFQHALTCLHTLDATLINCRLGQVECVETADYCERPVAARGQRERRGTENGKGVKQHDITSHSDRLCNGLRGGGESPTQTERASAHSHYLPTDSNLSEITQFHSTPGRFCLRKGWKICEFSAEPNCSRRIEYANHSLRKTVIRNIKDANDRIHIYLLVVSMRCTVLPNTHTKCLVFGRRVIKCHM